MNTIDRSVAPEYKAVETVDIIRAERQQLDNGIPLYVIAAGEQELVKIDFVFNAGEWDQSAPLIANSTMQMLAEGTLSQTADQIADKLDFLGSFVSYSSAKHQCVITLYSLNKYLDDTLRVLKEVVKRPSFPRNEYMILRNKQRQKFQIDNEKVEIISQQIFLENMFGADHPYGQTVSIEDFEKHETAGLRMFHEMFLTSKNCQIIVSGKRSSAHIESLNKFFGGSKWGNDFFVEETACSISGKQEKFLHVEKEGALQSSLRMGRLSINKSHEDYPKLQLLNTILGGYFGSRLMSKIREEKGYTYGIGSGLVTHQKAAYFTIVSNVGCEVRSAAVDAVMVELKKLRTELIPGNELELVKTHIMATMLRNFDGPFALSDNFRSMLLHGLNYDWYTNFISEIQSATPEELMSLANTYLHEDEMQILTVG